MAILLINQIKMKLAVQRCPRKYNIHGNKSTSESLKEKEKNLIHRETLREWVRFSSILIHPYIPASGLGLYGCLSSWSALPKKPPIPPFALPTCSQCQFRTRITVEFPRTWHKEETSWSLLPQLSLTMTKWSVEVNLPVFFCVYVEALIWLLER